MWLHAMGLRPFRIATGASGEVTQIGSHDAGITLGQAPHAREAIALIECFLNVAATVDTGNMASEPELELATDHAA